MDFDKRLGQLAGTWGKFVTEMVKPKIVELFKEKGIEIETIVQSVEGHKDGKKYYEIVEIVNDPSFKPKEWKVEY